MTLASIAAALFFISCARVAKWQETHTPPDDACRHCHYAIYKNWKIAYRPYNEAAKKEDYEPVHSSPMSAADVAKERGHRLGKGDCSQCHVGVEPEARLTISKIGASFEDTAFQLCGRCHKSTFEEWRWSRFASESVACIDCHTYSENQALAAREGYYHTREGLAAFTPDKIKPAIRMDRLRKAVTLSENILAGMDGISLSLMIANRGAGHNIPTGAGEAAMLVKVELIDEGGNVVSSTHRLIGAGGERPIAPDGELLIYINLAAPGRGNYTMNIALNYVDKTRDETNYLPILEKRANVKIK